MNRHFGDICINYSKAIVVISAVLVAMACSSNKDCLQNTEVAMGVQFKTTQPVAGGGQGNQVALSDTFLIRGLGRDSILSPLQKIEKIGLPLRPFDDSTSFVFQRIGKVADTVTFFHSNEENLVSLECGFMVTHKVLRTNTTNHSIDSVAIEYIDVKGEINKQNISMYFKVGE